MKTQLTTRERISAAMTILLIGSPFFATCLLNLDHILTERVKTMATDGRRLLGNPAFIDALTEAELIFVLAHEVLHCVLRHMSRRAGRDAELWNIAADYVINAELIRAKIGTMPKGGLYDPRFDGMGAEDVYAILDDERKQQQSQQGSQPQPQPQQSGDDQQPSSGSGSQAGSGSSPENSKGTKGTKDNSTPEKQGAESSEATASPQTGETGAGSNDPSAPASATGDDATGSKSDAQAQPGAGSQPDQQPGSSEDQAASDVAAQGDEEIDAPDPGGCGGVIDACDEGDTAGEAAISEEWERITRQAVAVAAKHAGKVPGFAQEALEEIKRQSEDWRTLLREFVDPSSRVDYSFTQPDRRFGTSPFILPGPIPDGINHIVIARDTSGSISKKMLALFDVEVQSFLDSGLVDKLTMIDCDTRVTRVEEYFGGDTIPADAKGRGGTSFKPVWQWLDENASDAAAVVYFTDLDPNDGFGDEPSLPLLWAAYNTRKHAPFGRTIHIRD